MAGKSIESRGLQPKGFLMVKNDEEKLKRVTEITVVQNWFEEVKRLVPAGKK